MKKSVILSAIALGFSFFNFHANAMESFFIESSNGKKIFNVQYYGVEDKNEKLAEFFGGDNKKFHTLSYNLSENIKLGLNNAFQWWADILGYGANINQPVQYFIGTYDKVNADAQGVSLIDGKNFENPNLVQEIIQNGKTVKTFSDLTDENQIEDMDKGEVAFGYIRIGENLGINDNDGNFGWVNNSYYAHPVAQSMRNIEITPVMFHEIGHSLGFLTDREENPLGLEIYDKNKDAHKIYIFGDNANNEKSFANHLRDQFGNKAEDGKWILTPEIFESENFKNAYKKESGGKILTADEVFFVDDIHMFSDNKRNGKVYLYFEGDNVSEVLDGKTFMRADGEQITGIPINLWEQYEPEFSHSDLSRSMMSHQNYRSYNNFLEAELAMLQDIGYNIDRRNFYGKSIYNDNLNFVNWQNYTACENGTYLDGYNYTNLGVGLHVYGSNNSVIQRGHILTKGYAGVGIRVDGLNDKITVNKNTEIHADGEYGMGILIAYGKNHEINVDGVVTADGLRGDAIHFEFGANSMGATTEYRGSYIRYVRKLSEGQPAIVKNIGLNDIIHRYEDFSFTDLNGGDFNDAMADNLNISGKISADSDNEGRAIYIAEESFVKNININSGAEIDGDIISFWKKFDAQDYGIFDKETKISYRRKNKTKKSVAEPLMIQYKNKKYLYKEYIPDLVTNLNFNSNFNFSRNILGEDNIKINVNGGTFNFSGDADVVCVNVSQNAKIVDGNFTVNNMDKKIAKDFSDDSAGKFINHGTIFAKNNDFIINGDFISDGILQFQNNNKIVVSGTADLNNSTIEIFNAQKNIPITILTADNISCDNIKIPDNCKIEIVENNLILTCE